MGDRPPTVANKRRHERVKTKLLGRYMLADGREAKCTVMDVSLGGVALTGEARGQVGENVVLYVDQIGRVEGTIVRQLDEGFAVVLDVSPKAPERLARRLNEIVAGGGKLAPEPERRSEPRIKLNGEATQRATADGREYKVVNLSFTGADVQLIGGERPAIGAVLELGKLRGKVVRHTAAGVAVKFIAPDGTLAKRLVDVG
jgi:hypothetical protein